MLRCKEEEARNQISIPASAHAGCLCEHCVHRCTVRFSLHGSVWCVALDSFSLVVCLAGFSPCFVAFFLDCASERARQRGMLPPRLVHPSSTVSEHCPARRCCTQTAANRAQCERQCRGTGTEWTTWSGAQEARRDGFVSLSLSQIRISLRLQATHSLSLRCLRPLPCVRRLVTQWGPCGGDAGAPSPMLPVMLLLPHSAAPRSNATPIDRDTTLQPSLN